MTMQVNPRAGDAPPLEHTPRNGTVATQDQSLEAGNGVTSGSRSTRQAWDEPQPKLTGSCCSPSSRIKQGDDEDRIGPAWLLMLLPLACCGGPFLIGALAVAGAAAWGVLGVVVAVALGATLVVIRRRRAARRTVDAERASSRPAAGQRSGAPR